MKKLTPFIIITSLLIGILVTIGTSRTSSLVDSNVNQYCGLSLNRQTGQLVKFNKCAVNTYGFPVKYITSNVSSTVTTNQSEYSSYSIGSTSISRLRFLADWAIWSVAAIIVVMAVSSTTTKSNVKKPASKKK